jgi:Helix-hairpin-helix motif
LIPLLTFGMLTFAVVLVAGVRLKDRRTQLFAGLYFVLVVLFCVGVQFTDEDKVGPLDAVLITVFLAAWLGGTVHVFLLQSRPPPASNLAHAPVPEMLTYDPAVVAAERRLSRRQEARELLRSDPRLAAELKIGRPDISGRSFDDGGLVDINHVPAAVLAAELDLAPALSEEIVARRERLGGFSTPEELLIYCERLSPERLQVIRDRLIFTAM